MNQPVAILELVLKDGVKRIPLTGEHRSAGKDPSNGVVIEDDPQVSRRHAAFERAGQSWSVRDLGSTNGTFVNGERIGEPRVLAEGDRVRLGRTSMIFREGRETSLTAPGASIIDSAVRDSLVVGSSVIETTAAMMFTDIQDSTPLAEALGERGWLRVLREHNAVIRKAVEAHHGRVVDTAGDGFFCAFSRPDSSADALRCAIAIQRAFADAPAQQGHVVKVRIGVHAGKVLETPEGDLVGDQVHVAARVSSQATGGQIVVSAVSRALAGRGFTYGPSREVQLKGVSEPQTISDVVWEKA